MPAGNNKMPNIDLSALLEGLIAADVKFILVGGLAAVVQGAPVTTMDIDIVHERSRENISKLLAFLRSVEAVHRRPDNQIMEPKKQDISGPGHALFTTRLGPLDVLGAIEGERTYEDLIAHAVNITFRGCSIHVLDLKTLAELKRESRNPEDKLRLAVLEETLRQLR